MKRKLLIPLVLAIVVAGALFMLNRRKTTSTQDHQTTVSTSPDSGAISPILSSKGPYDTSFASLDKRPVPAWFEDAKFGIFIHWGPYSVPAWSPKGSYAEWYQRWLKEKKTYGNLRPGAKEIWQHHAEVYGADAATTSSGRISRPMTSILPIGPASSRTQGPDTWSSPPSTTTASRSGHRPKPTEAGASPGAACRQAKNETCWEN